MTRISLCASTIAIFLVVTRTRTASTIGPARFAQCGADTECIRARRIDVSAAFFAETEFQETGSFVYRLYKSALGRRPKFSEFIADRGQVVAGANLQANKQTFAQEFVERAEFQRKYPTSMNAVQFVDALLATASRSSGARLGRSARAVAGALQRQ